MVVLSGRGGVFCGGALDGFRAKEYSPAELRSFSEPIDDKPLHGEGVLAAQISENNGQGQTTKGVVVAAIGLILSGWLYSQDLNKELYVFSVGTFLVGILFMLSGLMQQRGSYANGFVTIMNDFETMPATMKQLAVVQFFSWFALFAMWIYMTPAVTSHLYGTTDTTSKLYNDGADWVGLCMGVYNGIAALVAFGIPVVARLTSRRVTHLLCLSAGGLALLSIYFMSSPDYLMLSMVGIGIAWASILSVPYAMLAGSLPADKMGYYMGVFNFFIVIPQIVAAALLGFLIKSLFNGEPIYALVLGGGSMILAGLLCLRVKDRAGGHENLTS
jgi:maltose/moltooligosaccharide transporter